MYPVKSWTEAKLDVSPWSWCGLIGVGVGWSWGSVENGGLFVH